MNPSYFNNDELNLEILAEECAESIRELTDVIQIKSKIVRFGFEDIHPAKAETNRNRLEEELGHVQAMIEILTVRGIVDIDNINSAKAAKFERMENWYKRILEK